MGVNIFADIVQRPHKRRLTLWPILLGWGLFIAAILAPAVEKSGIFRGGLTTLSGWECLWWSFWMCPLHPSYIPFVVGNLAMLATPYYVARSFYGAYVRPVYWMAGSFIVALTAPAVVDRLLIGYYLWLVSFVCVGTGFFVLSRSPHSKRR